MPPVAEGVQSRFDEMVRLTIGPVLKSEGFLRTKYSFHRRVERNWEVINLQKSGFSDKAIVRFAANLGVGLDTLRGSRWADDTRPPVNKCQLRERLGVLITGEDTWWWAVTQDTDITEMGEAIVSALRQYGLPWLDAHATNDRLRELVRTGAQSLPNHHLHVARELMRELGETSLEAVATEQMRRRPTPPKSAPAA